MAAKRSAEASIIPEGPSASGLLRSAGETSANMSAEELMAKSNLYDTSGSTDALDPSSVGLTLMGKFGDEDQATNCEVVGRSKLKPGGRFGVDVNTLPVAGLVAIAAFIRLNLPGTNSIKFFYRQLTAVEVMTNLNRSDTKMQMLLLKLTAGLEYNILP